MVIRKKMVVSDPATDIVDKSDERGCRWNPFHPPIVDQTQSTFDSFNFFVWNLKDQGPGPTARRVSDLLKSKE